MKECYVEKCIEAWGRGYGSAHYDKEKYGVFVKPFNVLVRTFDTEKEACDYKLRYESGVI